MSEQPSSKQFFVGFLRSFAIYFRKPHEQREEGIKDSYLRSCADEMEKAADEIERLQGLAPEPPAALSEQERENFTEIHEWLKACKEGPDVPMDSYGELIGLETWLWQWISDRSRAALPPVGARTWSDDRKLAGQLLDAIEGCDACKAKFVQITRAAQTKSARCQHGYDLANLRDGTDTCSGCAVETGGSRHRGPTCSGCDECTGPESEKGSTT